MKNFIEFIEEYNVSNIHSTNLLKAFEGFNSIFEEIEKVNPVKYKHSLKEFHEIICGEHFNEYFAKCEVEYMHHTDTNGNEISGEIININCAKRIYDNKVRYIDNSITVWDVYVALNAQYHDYHCYYKELFPSDSDEIIKDKIINSAVVFWFKDEDGKHNKVWNYFK